MGIARSGFAGRGSLRRPRVKDSVAPRRRSPSVSVYRLEGVLDELLPVGWHEGGADMVWVRLWLWGRYGFVVAS